MGWYLRKAFSFGPLRLNLSKSGLDYSFGVKGARIGVGPRGNYIHMGRYGLYYRQYFGADTSERDRSIDESPQSPVELNVAGTIVPTADVNQLQDSSADELLNYIRDQHRKPLIAPWVSTGAGALLAGMIVKGVAIQIVGPFLVLAILSHFVVSRFDAGRKRVVLRYRLDQTAQAWYQAFSNAMTDLCSAQRVWRIITLDRSADTKYTAGAGALVNRDNVVIRSQVPRGIEADLAVWNMVLGRQSLYFFPDRILVYQGSEVGAVPYSELSAESAVTVFVESDGVPSDARVVGSTWRYVNKGGGPDRRFANNPQIPVAEYAQIALHSTAGLNFLLQCSNVAVSRSFVEGLSNYCRIVLNTQIDQSSRESILDGAEPALRESVLEGWGWAAAPVLLAGMLLALLLAPRGNYLQALSSTPTSSPVAVEQPLPSTRVLRQKGTQVVVAIPAGTTDSDLLRLLRDLRTKVEESRFSDLGINVTKGIANPSSGTLLIFKTDGSKIPRPLVQSDATLKWTHKGTTGTVLKPDGRRVSAFP